ncbi:MAG: two-component sensor histidine kinase, partial [Acetobacteraceae bacterium]|nr:two-component sensor histidine kinase [Acetobacteraceae bacterium]
MVLTALALACAPVIVLLVLAATGALAIGAALAASLPVAGAALALAFLWQRDLERLAEALRRLAGGIREPLSSPPALPPVGRISREIERLSRTLADRAAQVGRMRRADEVIFERLPDPLIVLAADRTIRRANHAARTAYGTDTQALLRHPGLYGAIDRAFAQGTTQTAELTLAVPVPREVHARVIFLDEPLADGGRAVVVLSDRTRERAVERMRADFVANASHELRTPLASLIGFIETLRGPAIDDPPAQRRFLAIMAEQAARMNRLIDDLLSLSRVELTEHQPPQQTVDLAALVPRLAAAFEPRLRESGTRLEQELPDTPLPVTGDADQLAQVVQNLLDNALKYGRP